MGERVFPVVAWAWPSAARAALAARTYLLLGLLFGLVYFGANWWAANHAAVAYWHADWERAIPFVPGAIVVYLSIALVFALPVFALDEGSFNRMARRFAIATVGAGLFFVLMPLRIGFDRPAVVPSYEALFATLYRFDAPFNTVPSLHIAYSTLILWTLFIGSRSRAVRIGCAAWWLAICASVLLVHQHHVADVVGGILLGAVCAWPPRQTAQAQA